MPDPILKTLTPLGLDAPRTDSVGTIGIAENVSRALASLTARRGAEERLAGAAESVLSLPLPRAGKSVANETFRIIWTGSGQFLVEAPFESHEDIARTLKQGFGNAASVTEQTDAWARFDVTGPNLSALFERLVPVDLHRMAADDATRTMLEHIGVFLLCLEPRRRYTVLGPRSSAGSLHHALVTAARSVT